MRILDFSQAWAGPIASMMLADLGAEVVKIEPPGLGDHVRGWTRPDLHGLSPYYLSANRNKRGIVLDLKTERGREIALELAERADVLLENFRPGAMDRLGLGWEIMHARNPALIYCSVSGYGSDGPYARRAAYDLLIQGEGGLLSVTGQSEDQLAKIGIPAVDVVAANVAAFTILAAYTGRGSSGAGERLDISMLEIATTFMSTLLIDYAISGKVAKPMGTGNQLLAPYQVYPTKSRPIVLGVLTEAHWAVLCDVLNRPDLLSDPRFETAPIRVINRDALNDELVPILATEEAEHWVEVLGGLGLAAGFVNNVETLLDHPQHDARGFIKTQVVEGVPVRAPGAPWRLSSSTEEDTRPPSRGQHTVEVLADWLSMPASDIEVLTSTGVAVQAPPERSGPGD